MQDVLKAIHRIAEAAFDAGVERGGDLAHIFSKRDDLVKGFPTKQQALSQILGYEYSHEENEDFEKEVSDISQAMQEYAKYHAELAFHAGMKYLSFLQNPKGYEPSKEEYINKTFPQ